MSKQTGSWSSKILVDMLGKPFSVGDKVVRSYTSGRATNLQINEVTRIDIDNEKVYLDNSKVAINFPGRLLIINALFQEESK